MLLCIRREKNHVTCFSVHALVHILIGNIHRFAYLDNYSSSLKSD